MTGVLEIAVVAAVVLLAAAYLVRRALRTFGRGGPTCHAAGTPFCPAANAASSMRRAARRAGRRLPSSGP